MKNHENTKMSKCMIGGEVDKSRDTHVISDIEGPQTDPRRTSRPVIQTRMAAYSTALLIAIW